jgi:hypothetical protein
MTTTMTPPPVPPVPAGDAPGSRPPRRGSARAVATVAIVAGSVLLAGAVTTSVVSSVRNAGVRAETLTADAAGVVDLQIDIAAADLTIAYADTDRAELAITGNPSDWRLDRVGDALTVRTDRGWWPSFGGFDGGDRAVLTLPESFSDREVDAALSLSAGSITADGVWRELDVDLSAGAIDVTGAADALDIDVSAGRTTVDLADVSTAIVGVSAGSVNGELTGAAPDDVQVDVSAGRVDLVLPDESYRVVSDVSAGSFDNRLDTSDSASRDVTVSVSAGNVTLRTP